MFDLTVAICTYNGANRLPKVLTCLRSQIDTHTFSWSVLVVDNNSTDSTAQVVHQHQTDWPSASPLIYCFEPQQGLAFARRHAVQQAQSTLIAFLDDDNWPAPDWIRAAFEFGLAYPKVGAYGGQILPFYEGFPPAGFQRIAPCLAICEGGHIPYRYSQKKWRFPAGAGLVVRRQVWLDCVPAQPRLKGVCGTALTSKGEDLESLSYLNRAGWEIWHNPAMKIQHHIPRHRLEPAYLLRLFQGIGLGRYPTRMIRFAPWQRPLMLLLFVLSDLRKLVWHWMRQPLFSEADIVVACERRLLVCSLISPIYHWQQALKQQALIQYQKETPLASQPSSISSEALP
ncbi:MAG TPA: hormogonium polysaccharide biosynthesis glycosyltransferase HpsE [Trichocoleus sp.]